MKLAKRLQAQSCEFVLSGDFGYDDHPIFREVIDQMAVAGTGPIVLNMAGVQSIDSAALGMLMLAKKEADKNGKKLSVIETKGMVQKILEMVKFDFG